MPRLTLVLGGARSGKSRHAEALVRSLGSAPVYLATAQVWDQEMAERVRLHQNDRMNGGWQTIEEPQAIAPLLRAGFDGRPVLVDCLTLWLSNVLLAGEDPCAPPAPSPEQAIADLLEAQPFAPARWC